jgi:hypothetical protein
MDQESIKKMPENSSQKESIVDSIKDSLLAMNSLAFAKESIKTPMQVEMVKDFHLSNIESYKTPTLQESNKYQSASVLMEALSTEALRWKETLSENHKPAIIALLYGGLQIHVSRLSQVSFHGIQIEGTLDGFHCSLLAHQSTVQMLCYAEEITEETPKQPIGFIWDNNKIEV